VLLVFIDPPGYRPINRFINPENPLITRRVIRIRDNILKFSPNIIIMTKSRLRWATLVARDLNANSEEKR
jgi:hypothetical protein